jgi:tetratricopeptide (TPR) repeat protein
VPEQAVSASSEPAGADELLQLALSRPRDALARARAILSGRPEPRQALIAHQAAGIVLRDTADVEAGVRELRAALRLARRLGSADSEADVLSSLGTALVQSGRTTAGLAAYVRAVGLASGVMLGRVLYRRGYVYWKLGRYAAALDDLRRAVSVLERAGDVLWAARALNGRGLAYLNLGSPRRADADFAAAERLYAQTGQELESVHPVLNRGVAAFQSGDLPAALAYFDAAAARYRPLNFPALALSQVRCLTLRAAGLAAEALGEANSAVAESERINGDRTRQAELMLTAARCALAAGRPSEAIERGEAAYRQAGAQRSPWLRAHAGLALVQARYAAEPASGRLLAAAWAAARRLDELDPGEAAEAHLLAGRIALELGRLRDAEPQLRIAAGSRRRGPAMARITGWLAAALQARAASQPRAMLGACRRGLDVLDEHQWTLGASELRALATAQGSELAGIGLRHAAVSGSARGMLVWTERWRATALAVPAVRPPVDAELNAGLAELRAVTGRLEEARQQGGAVAALAREQVRLEGVVRARSLLARGATGGSGLRLDVAELLAGLGDRQLLEIVELDGTLHVLLCGRGRVRRFAAGRTADAVRAAEFARFALRRLARARPGDGPDSALAILETVGPRLEDALIGPAANYLADGPAVIVPPGRLHAIPWALLPSLTGREFSVAPSARAWLRAHATRPPARRRVLLASGPGLVTGGAEVPLVSPLYPDVTVLSGAQATAGRVLAGLDGAWLGHIAAHGTFRADSPMFSSLRLHDGPLTVYDFEQLGRAPYQLVLSSCDSGMLAPAGADELLGLASSLLPLGTAGIIAGVVQLNDYALVPLMVQLHACIAAGQSLAEAACGLRREAAAEPAQRAAALSLLALGAG